MKRAIFSSVEKKSHGGKRAGSGRKGSKSSSHSVRLADEVWALRDALALKLGLDKRRAMERAIREMAERNEISTSPHKSDSP